MRNLRPPRHIPTLQYTEQFRRLVRESGTQVLRLPPMSPNLNAYAERFVRSIKEECLKRMISIGQASLRRAVTEYMEHYHEERNHQGLENRLIRPRVGDAANGGYVHRSQRAGGMFNFYHRMAARTVSTEILDITGLRINSPPG